MVAGISKSGESCARFLLDRGAEVYLYDDVVSENISAVMNELASLGAHIVTAESYIDATLLCDILVLSPGIPIDNPLPFLQPKSKTGTVPRKHHAGNRSFLIF